VIGPSQRTLPDNTQHSPKADLYIPSGIRTCIPSKRADADPHRRTFIMYPFINPEVVIISKRKCLHCNFEMGKFWVTAYMRRDILVVVWDDTKRHQVKRRGERYKCSPSLGVGCEDNNHSTIRKYYLNQLLHRSPRWHSEITTEESPCEKEI